MLFASEGFHRKANVLDLSVTPTGGDSSQDEAEEEAKAITVDTCSL